MEYKNLKFQVKSLSDEGMFSGYAAVKNNVDSYGDIIQDTAFKRTLDNNKQFPILWMHDPKCPIGLSTVMKEDSKGLYTEGKLDLGTELGRMVHSGIKNKYIDALSIGYKVIKDEINKKGNRLLKEIKLMEYSMITKGFAANELALVSNFKSSTDLDNLIKRLNELEQKLEHREDLMAKQDYMDEEYMVDDMGEEEAIDEEDIADETESEAELLEEAMELCDDLHTKLGVIKDRIEGKACGSKKPKRMGDSSKMALAHMTDSLNSTQLFEEKAVGGSNSFAIAPKEKPWSGAAAQKRIFDWAGGMDFSPSKAKQCFFYHDPANPKERGSYKLPFCDIENGTPIVIPRAISAVKGALDGARGGVDIPNSDKADIRRKVDAYLKRINKDMPKSDLHDLFLDMKNFVRSVK